MKIKRGKTDRIDPFSPLPLTPESGPIQLSFFPHSSLPTPHSSCGTRSIPLPDRRESRRRPARFEPVGVTDEEHDQPCQERRAQRGPSSGRGIRDRSTGSPQNAASSGGEPSSSFGRARWPDGDGRSSGCRVHLVALDMLTEVSRPAAQLAAPEGVGRIESTPGDGRPPPH